MSCFLSLDSATVKPLPMVLVRSRVKPEVGTCLMATSAVRVITEKEPAFPSSGVTEVNLYGEIVHEAVNLAKSTPSVPTTAPFRIVRVHVPSVYGALVVMTSWLFSTLILSIVALVRVILLSSAILPISSFVETRISFNSDAVIGVLLGVADVNVYGEIVHEAVNLANPTLSVPTTAPLVIESLYCPS